MRGTSSTTVAQLAAISTSACSTASGQTIRSQSTLALSPSPAWIRSGGMATGPDEPPTTNCWKTGSRLDLDAGTDGGIVRPGLGILRPFARQIQRDPMPAGRRVLDQLRLLAGGGQQHVAPAVAREIRHHAAGVAVRADRAEQVARIGLGGVRKALLRPAVDQQRRPAAAVAAGGIRHHHVQVAVVVHVGELAARAAQPAAAAVNS